MIDVKIRALKLRSAGRCAIAMALVCVASAALAHDDHGHEHPLRLPPLGPHGGRHAALGIHHVEFSASGNRACFYFLDRT